MSKFGQIKLGRNTKKYSNPGSVDVNTTFPFGVVQPELKLLLENEESISGDFRELVRLAPLPVPSFARMYKETYMRFVPMAELCPFYDNIRAKISYSAGDKSYIPQRVPVTDNKMLVFWLITNYCQFSLFAKGDDGLWSYSYPQNGALQALLSQYYDLQDGTIWPNYLLQKFLPDQTKSSSFVTIDNSDFNLVFSTDTQILCCKLNGIGRVVRSNLLGLGYSLNIQDTDELSLLPILAYEKAYFDTYFPQREISWSDLAPYSFIRKVETNYPDHNGLYTFDKDAIIDYTDGLFLMLDFLSSTFATLPLDYVSAHRDGATSVDRSVSFYDGVGDSVTTLQNDSSSEEYQPSISNYISRYRMMAINKLSQWINKDSVIGQHLSNWVKVHLGGDVGNSLYKDTNKIGYYRLDMSINPVISQSDTVSTGGEYLGGYAGEGLGYQSGQKYSFDASQSGYVIAFSTIIPDSKYFQGNQTDLTAVDFDTMYNREYDAMGYEITSYNTLFSDNGFAKPTPHIQGGFGFVPRYSGLKTYKNVVNGDMSRRGTIDSMSPYYLDRMVITSSYTLTEKSEGKYQFDLTMLSPTEAGTDWQYPTRYAWMGNFNRIFYNNTVPTSRYAIDNLEADDNFMCQAVFNFNIKSNKLPISQSYDTFDEDTDNSTINVNNE